MILAKNGDDVIEAFGARLVGLAIDRSGDLNQRDVITGGPGRDLFVLGDLASSYYIGDQDQGFARITDFHRGDRVVLTGFPSDYTTTTTSINGLTGIGIFQGEDLVALLQGKGSESFSLSNPSHAMFIA